MQRSATLRCLYSSASKFGGRPPALPFFLRAAAWASLAGVTAVIPPRRGQERVGLRGEALCAARAGRRRPGAPAALYTRRRVSRRLGRAAARRRRRYTFDT